MLAYSSPNDEAPLRMGIMLVTARCCGRRHDGGLGDSLSGPVHADLRRLIAGGWFLRGGPLGIRWASGVG